MVPRVVILKYVKETIKFSPKTIPDPRVNIR